ncbi:mersacidin/lichenicidin family type 2 lantibiotic [Ktedonobacter racemifer]|uniref:Mersacidin/lichenicidin family type 2 lantibiotic n=1 Tax=Ktedonobacter racemifer DSM 44963 TaxID=485913 RepID=D6TJ68_KTERA|nr:mersacidin/lichenicidin family type 2 lantibiotic [Ktedonobacter racemifer]EFH89475.1 hypothetical protein Krac_11033 [Ktedonobacter racemifer DSM 44963]
MQYDIVRAWKDEEYRQGLGQETLAENPAGVVELSDESLEIVSGGCHHAWHRGRHEEENNTNQQNNVNVSYTYGNGGLIGNVVNVCAYSLTVIGSSCNNTNYNG